MSNKTESIIRIRKFHQVEVGTVVTGVGEFYKHSNKQGRLVFNQRNGYLWQKLDLHQAQLVVAGGRGDFVEVTNEMLNGQMPDDYYDPHHTLLPEAIISAREISASNWRHPMGRVPDLVVKFGPLYVVGIVANAPRNRVSV